MGDILLQRGNGKVANIENVFYVSGISYNLLIIGQLIEKKISITRKNDEVKLFDKNDRLVLTSPLSNNRTFRTSISITEADYLIVVIPDSESLHWNKRYGLLNFRSLSTLKF